MVQDRARFADRARFLSETIKSVIDPAVTTYHDVFDVPDFDQTLFSRGGSTGRRSLPNGKIRGSLAIGPDPPRPSDHPFKSLLARHFRGQRGSTKRGQSCATKHCDTDRIYHIRS